MPSKTPSISHFFLFIVGMISVHSANAAAPRNLAECQQAYFTAVSVPVAQRETPTVQNQLKSWCTSQCVEEKINVYAAQQNQQVTEALRTQLTPNYQQTCTAQFAASTSSSVATTPATGTGTAPATLPECTWTGQPTPTQQNACQQAIQRKQADDQRKAAAAAEQQRLLDQQRAAESAQRRGTNTMLGAALGPQVINSIAQGLGGANSGSGSGSSAGGSGSSSGNTGGYALPQLDLSGNAGNQPGAAPPAPIPAPTQVGTVTDSAAGQMNQTAGQLEQPLQWPARQAQDQVDTDRAGRTVVPRSAISQSAQQNAQTLASEANNLLQQLRQRLCQNKIDGNAEGVYKKTMAEFERGIGNAAVQGEDGCTSASTYTNPTSFGLGNTVPADGVPVTAGADGATGGTNASPSDATTSTASGSPQGQQGQENPLALYNRGRAVTCAGDAERAEKLCVESDSMKALKGVMDAAGPVLMGLNAAARTCGGMNNVSKFVGAGLTAANAICIAKKMKCERTCSELARNFNSAMGQLEQKFAGDGGAAKADKDRIEQNVCVPHQRQAATHRTNAQNASTAGDTVTASTENGKATEEDQKYNACKTANENVFRSLPQAVQRISAFKQRENNPGTPGTAIAMDAKCKEKTRNIVGLATNIGAILLAAQNAKKCEKELAANGAEGNTANPNVAGTEYCSNEATRDSQFCKCKSSPSTEGCGAVLAAGPPGENTPQDQRGVNLQSGRGPSAFAGAGAGGSSGSSGGYRGYNGGADGGALTQANLGSVTSSMGGGSGSSVGAAGAGGAGATGSGAATADSKGSKKEDDKSKWSFGSFASSIGSSLGFGGGSGSRGGDTGSAFPANQKEMIERKLASDQYAAEISPSTGADNFSKVKRSYVRKADTFMGP